MPRGLMLPARLLAQVHQFLLELHAATEPEAVRTTVTSGLSRLIACDRSSFNEIEFSDEIRTIAPTPVPSWWPRFADVYLAHATDHPLWSRAHPPRLNRSISFDDACYASTWQRSALNHEYFKPLGMPHQISAMIFRSGNLAIGISVNRSKAGFSSDERALLDLLCPHISQAWINALLIASLLNRLGAEAGAHRSEVPAALTTREREILTWMAEGKRNCEIAVILSLSARTVEKHVEHILEKLGVETRSAAIRQAMDTHITTTMLR